MRLHTAIISYNRWGLTEQTLRSLQATVDMEWSCVIVDNASGPETQKWLRSVDVPVIYLDKNYYPGYAANRGFEHHCADEATFLHRSDNDTLYHDGWCVTMRDIFDRYPEVGQWGPIAEGDEEYAANPNWPVGGNCVIRKTLWDEGIRYNETPWPECTIIEEHQLTIDVAKAGWQHLLGPVPGITYLTDGDDEYTRQSYADRGLTYGG